MSVQFDEEPRSSAGYQQVQNGKARVRSQKAKASLAALAVILLALAGIIWAKFGNPTRPPVSDTRSTRAQTDASL